MPPFWRKPKPIPPIPIDHGRPVHLTPLQEMAIVDALQQLRKEVHHQNERLHSMSKIVDDLVAQVAAVEAGQTAEGNAITSTRTELAAVQKTLDDLIAAGGLSPEDTAALTDATSRLAAVVSAQSAATAPPPPPTV